MMSACTDPACAVLEEGSKWLEGAVGDNIDSVRCAVADVEQWLEGEDAQTALVRNVVLQLEAVRRTQLLQEQEIHGRNRELHELHDMLQALLSGGEAQSKQVSELQARLDEHHQMSRQVSELQARLDEHHQMFEGSFTGTKLSTSVGSQLEASSADQLTQAIETLVRRLNLMEQRLVGLENATSAEDIFASRCMRNESSWVTEVRASLESLAEDVGRQLADLASEMESHGRQLDSLQAAHSTLAEEASERAHSCHSELMSHFALFVKKEDACEQQATLDNRITCLERATVGSLQGTSLNFHPGRTGASATARGRSAAAEGNTHTPGEQETQKIHPEAGDGMEEDGNERWPGPEVQRTSTSVERNHSSLQAVFQPPRTFEPVASPVASCVTKQEWRPCSVLPARCNVGTTAAVRSLSATAIERRGKAVATTVGPVLTTHSVTPAVTSNYVLLQRSAVPNLPPMPLTCRETSGPTLVIQSPSTGSPPVPTVADTLFSKIDANKDGVISRSEWMNALEGEGRRVM